MALFRFTHEIIDPAALRRTLTDATAGGYASFEGWVRNHNEGRPVRKLEYQAFETLAVKEGERIVSEALARFGVEHAACVHRVGDLAIGDMAVWVGVSARHRREAFLACRYIIDEVKHRVPIWKKEHYEDGDAHWVNCERCAAHAHEPTSDYSRQIALKDVGAAGQAKLRASRVLVVGCGGLGVPAISYLAGAGIGRLGLVDGDRLDPSNLHRQTFYALGDAGKLKAVLAAERVTALNPDVEVNAHAVRLDERTALALIPHYDLVLDCTDNFASKFLLNDVCLRLDKPCIFASVYQYEGQIQILRPDLTGAGKSPTACLRCIWPEATRDGIVGNCSEAGVLGPVPGVFGTLQALEAMKILLDLPGQLINELLVLDLLTLQITRLHARRAESCPDHAGRSSGVVELSAHDVEIAVSSLEEAAGTGYEIVDIREPGEVSAEPAPLAGILHQPLAQLLHGEPRFDPAGKTLLVCATGRRSLAPALELRSRGLENVFSLRGGLAAMRARLLA